MVYHGQMQTSKPLSSLAWLARIVQARPHLFACAALGILVPLALPADWTMHLVTRLIIGWNAGALVYLLLAMRMMFWSSHESMRTRAMSQDEGRLLILAIVVVGAIAALAAIVLELSVAKGLQGTQRYLHIALAGGTLVTSWAFTQVMFAQHYAHDFFLAQMRGEPGGLDFPGGEAPDYGDFLYFACVIGTSAQTADVSLTSRVMRRTGLLHCVLAFVFNATLLALTINIASGLF
jgi:uncharacterized membrane protein